jgi:selenoprotein W-related protein
VRAVGAAAELLNQYEADIESLSIIPSSGGRFELVVDGHLLYSKLATGRHVENGEVSRLVKNYLQEGK